MTTGLSLRDGPAPGPGSGPAALLEIRDLRVRFDSPHRQVHAVNGVDLEVLPGEVFALVGESGSGKSVSMLSVMGLVEQPPAVVSGSIRFDGQELIGLKRSAMNRFRGKEIGMVFQDPMSSLNPVHPIGRQIAETLRLHEGVTRKAALARAAELLHLVGIPNASSRVDDFPHEFSGGMRQRVMIAIALACSPRLLIADEPTTALDVTVQRQIVALVKNLQRELAMAVVWITHDLGVVAEIADRVAVMYGGRIMETGTARDVYATATHPYTTGLLHSIPSMSSELTEWLPEIPGTPRQIVDPLTACPFHERCPLSEHDCTDGVPALVPVGDAGHRSACLHNTSVGEGGLLWPGRQGVEPTLGSQTEAIPVVAVDGLQVHFPVHRRGRRHLSLRAVDGVTLQVSRGQTLGVVGESGCGKSTLGRALVGLVEPTAGTVEVHGRPLDTSSGPHRRTVQMVFQDPFSSMNPGMRVGEVVAEPLRIHGIGTASDRRQRVEELLEQVGLDAAAADRYPHEFSGGQRQRIAIARALAAEPDVIVCDEPVSALDVSVQAQIVNLLHQTQLDTGVALIFIAHDLAVVRHISDEIVVMYMGQIVERAPHDQMYSDPQHPYTKALLAAVPDPDPTTGRKLAPALEGDLPDPTDPPPGCRFHTRCPVAVAGLCDTTEPRLEPAGPNRWAACHLVDKPVAASSSFPAAHIAIDEGETR